jgi:4-hydroxyisophthalate hydroxylase
MNAQPVEADIRDVVIVGGGPVGMGLAIELGQRNISVVVVERYPEPQPIPKGQNLTQRTLEHFRAWGVEDEIRKAAPIPAERGIGGLTAYGTLLSDYHYDWYQRALVRPFYLTDNERLPQYTTEEVLRRRVQALPSIEVLYGWSAEAVAQDDTGASVTIAQRAGGERRTLRGRYLIGCDGSRSVVRETSGITQTRSDHDVLMVLLVFRSEQLSKLLERYPGKSFFNVLHPDLEGYWQFFGRVDLDETWFFHAPVPAGTTEDNFNFRGYLQGVVGAKFDCELTHIGFWDLRIAIADSYREDRIFIAGDAAHSHPPYGGFGINTGFEDARNLGWKLAAVLAGWGGEKLLDSYTLERRPVFASTAKDFIEAFISQDDAFLRTYDPTQDKAAFEQAWAARSAGTSSEIQSFEPHYEGSPLVFGPTAGTSSAVGIHRFAATAGHHLTPQTLSSGDNVFDQLGDGFSLLAFDADDTVVAAFETAASALSISLTVIRDAFADGRAKYDARLILVRPDQYVAWADNGTGIDARAVLERATGRR